jgi:hypothetical protein
MVLKDGEIAHYDTKPARSFVRYWHKVAEGDALTLCLLLGRHFRRLQVALTSINRYTNVEQRKRGADDGRTLSAP